jgi:hypothetical protein
MHGMTEGPEFDRVRNQPADPASPASAAPDASEPRPRPTRPAWIGWAVATLVIAMVLGGFFGARAFTGKSGAAASPAASPTSGGSSAGGLGGRPGTSGTIASMNGASITVTDAQLGTTVSVTTSSATRVTVTKTVALSDIVKGDSVVVTGTGSGRAITATRISDSGTRAAGSGGRAGGRFGGRFGAGGRLNGSGPPGSGPGRGAPPGSGSGTGGFAAGTVTNVHGNTLVLASRNGSAATTVTTTASTTVTKTMSASLTDLKVGESVQISGTTGPNGVVAATSIREGGGFGFRGGGFGAGGSPPAGTNPNSAGA